MYPIKVYELWKLLTRVPEEFVKMSVLDMLLMKLSKH